MDWKMSAIFAVVSFFGLGSLVYVLLREDDENKDALFFRKPKTAVVEVKISKKSIGAVIGKGGNTIKDIESKSDTTIKIKDDYICEDFKICVIRGTSECVLYAECLIHEIIISQSPVETFEMYVPAEACGRIIGKGGENIRTICRSSRAKLFLESDVTSPEVLGRKLVIKGTVEQISLAKILVEQKLEEEKAFAVKVENLMPVRHHRKKCVLPVKEEEKEAESCRPKGKSVDDWENDLLEVYLSAVESPDRFWLQKAGRCFADLNDLVDEMTQYYSKEENKQLHKLESPKSGRIVAVPVLNYGKWFRAKILNIQIETSAEEPEILFYNVDFGGTGKCKKRDVHRLRSDFLKLRFQAIECMLAKVEPRHSTWSEEAINHLKALKPFGMWHSIRARIVNYKERCVGTKKELIPCVELYDTYLYRVVDVAEVLVQNGLAVWKKKEEEEVKSSGFENPTSDLESEETFRKLLPPVF